MSEELVAGRMGVRGDGRPAYLSETEASHNEATTGSHLFPPIQSARQITSIDQFAWRQRNVPDTICIELLKKCNLSCPHCRSGSSPRASGTIDETAILEFIRRMVLRRPWRISLTGGEPTLWGSLSLLLGL